MPSAKGKGAKLAHGSNRSEQKTAVTQVVCPTCKQHMRQNEIMATQVIDLATGSGRPYIELHHAPKACTEALGAA